ncbi:hypothetical protein FH972_025450 [Carpinus fangiana]|uniref:Uncharacterized protein n=1 Tax=Carpinus fangiana TaxID=176857 RepID=A0A5N6L130_9ROSI|nr:hypothetical protein FH972_025450 [Carpinus fangiana]
MAVTHSSTRSALRYRLPAAPVSTQSQGSRSTNDLPNGPSHAHAEQVRGSMQARRTLRR